MVEQLIIDETEAVDIGGIDDPLAALLGRPSRFHMTRLRVTQGAMRIDFCRIAEHGWLAIIVALGDVVTAVRGRARVSRWRCTRGAAGGGG
jgi:hypothetical protein